MDFKPVSLPTLTHLQALVCWALHSPYWEALTVRDLLGVLRRHEVAMSESAFYQLMQRMESAGHVESEVDPQVRRRQSRTTGRMQSRLYRLTRSGREELARTMDFYRRHLDHPRRLFCADLNVTLLTEDDWNGDRAIKDEGRGAAEGRGARGEGREEESGKPKAESRKARDGSDF
jgi:DNA-binding PadR family transcriptional regulator